jgi:predicted nucleic acid-binding protein
VISVDTSIVVRYLVGTPVAQAKRANALMDGGQRIGISVVALVEAAHVLRTQYGVDRSDVLETLIELLTREGIELLGLSKADALAAFVRARSLPGGPIPDALIAATAASTKALPVYTFDQEFARHGVPVEVL